MRDFSERLIAHATRGNKSSKTETPAIFLVVEKLRPNLATLLGKLGFRALLSRALALTTSEIAWLRAVHVKADGSLEGLHELEAQLDPEEIAEGTVVLLAQLLGLLVLFIGESLTLRLVRDVWPKLSLDD
jgi:nicotinic acid phosphoribosyltransferase